MQNLRGNRKSRPVKLHVTVVGFILVMDSATIKALSSDLLKLTVTGAQLSRTFPSSDDLEFFLTLYPEVKGVLDEARGRCFSIVEKLMQVGQPNAKKLDIDYKDVDDVLEHYEDFVEVTDEKLETIVFSFYFNCFPK